MAEQRQLIYQVLLDLGNSPEEAKRAASEISKITASANQASDATQNLSKTTKELSKLQENQARSAGLAGAAAFELGRTISDLPFGIVAVTNNISQLGTLFAALVSNAGSLRKALSLLFGQLIGPAGILIAFQAVTAAITFFAQQSNKAEKDVNNLKKSIEEMNEAISEQRSILEALGRAAIYSPEARKALAANMKEVKAFLEAAESVGDVTPEVIDRAVQLGIELLEARRKANIEQQKFIQITKDDTATESQRISAGTALAEALAEVERAQDRLNIQKQESIELTAKQVKRTQEEIEALKELGTTFEQLAEGRQLLLRLGFDFDAAEDMLIKSGIDAVKGFQERVESEGESNVFLDTFGFSEENITAAIDAAQQGLAAMGDIFASQAEREIAIETNKTNAINDQLRIRLANEQMSADERDRINQEIARNEAELVRKENQINKQRFEQEKAVNIALATINTFSAATGVLAETKGGSFARIAGMIAVIGAGLAQVAMISRQQFQSKAMPNPRLTGLGESDGASGPAFNVVGASSQNQLAQVIAAQNATPIKTYVVSSDVSTAQELDRKIIEGASI